MAEEESRETSVHRRLEQRVFYGDFRHTLDAKGRVTLPAPIRKQLGTVAFITRGEDFCLQVYTPEAWAKKIEEVQQRSLASKENRDYVRGIFAATEELELDKAGRLRINAKLREYARLEDSVAIIGVGDFVEIWREQTWDEEAERGARSIGDRDIALAPQP